MKMDFNSLRQTFSVTPAIEVCFHRNAVSAVFWRSLPPSQEGAMRRVRIHAAPPHSDNLSVGYLEYGEHSGEGLVGLPYGCSFMLKFSKSVETLREEQRILGGVSALRLQGCKVSVPLTIEGIYSCRLPGNNFDTSFFIMEHCQKTPIGIADSIPTSIL